MTDEIPKAVEMAQNDPEIHVLSVQGAGLGFCAGHDLSHAGGIDDGGVSAAR